jgi:opacity protein-like surface antigen
MRVLSALVLTAAMPLLGAAQSIEPGPLPANDVGITLGWAGGEHNTQDQQRWHGSLLVGVSGGHYWTDHLKTEVEASWNSAHNKDVYQTLERQGGFTYALSDYRAHDVRIGLVQIFQFGRNQWVHPYVGVGAGVVRRRTTLERERQSRFIYLQNRTIPVEIPAAIEHDTTVFGEAVIKTGVKMYVTERTFFNTDLRFGIRPDIDHVVWKFGLGLDF